MMLRGETASPKRTLPVADFSPQSYISGPHGASPHTDNGAPTPQLMQNKGLSLSRSIVVNTHLPQLQHRPLVTHS